MDFRIFESERFSNVRRILYRIYINDGVSNNNNINSNKKEAQNNNINSDKKEAQNNNIHNWSNIISRNSRENERKR